MSEVDLTKTTFGNLPTEGLETIDAYSSSGIDSFLTNPLEGLANSSLLSDLFPDLKADKIADMLKDVYTNEFLAVQGMSFSDLVKAVKNALPPGVNLYDLVTEMRLPDILSFADGLRESLSVDKWRALDSNFFLNIYKSYNKFIDRWSEGGDWPQYLKGAAIAEMNDMLTGTGFTVDILMDAAYKFGVVDYLMENGIAENFIEFIDDANLPDELKQMIYSDLVAIAAKTGYSQYINDLINLAQKEYKPWQSTPTLRSLLQGYRKPRGYNLSKATTEAATLVDTTIALVPDWYLYDRNSTSQASTQYMNYASEDALDILRYDERTRVMAATYYTWRQEIEPWQSRAVRDFPFMNLT
ncbi:hypothetical protein [Vibrio phage BONAISHI]|nr:hypothetical protein [Vibrio phage BONAISHI]